MCDALNFNGLTLNADEPILAAMLSGGISGPEFAEAICSGRPMGLESIRHLVLVAA